MSVAALIPFCKMLRCRANFIEVHLEELWPKARTISLE
jgi:hypothetical protein